MLDPQVDLVLILDHLPPSKNTIVLIGNIAIVDILDILNVYVFMAEVALSWEFYCKSKGCLTVASKSIG